MPTADEYAKARRRAETKYKFRIHAVVFAAVMTLLVLINVLTMPGTIWFIWPLLGWGTAVAIHGARVYLFADSTEVLDAQTKRELRHVADQTTD